MKKQFNFSPVLHIKLRWRILFNSTSLRNKVYAWEEWYFSTRFFKCGGRDSLPHMNRSRKGAEDV